MPGTGVVDADAERQTSLTGTQCCRCSTDLVAMGGCVFEPCKSHLLGTDLDLFEVLARKNDLLPKALCRLLSFPLALLWPRPGPNSCCQPIEHTCFLILIGIRHTT